MEYTRTFTLDIDVGDRAELRIDSRSGTVTVRGDDTRQVRVDVVARLWADSDASADEQAEQILHGVQREGQRITIHAPTLLWPRPIFFGRGPRIDYHLTVPRNTLAHVASRSGRVECANIAGPLRVEAGSGRVDVSRIGDDTTIVSRSGGIQAESIAGSLGIDSRSGGIQARHCKGSMSIISRSGPLRIEHVGGSVEIDSRSGSITISDVGGALLARSRSGGLRYEGAVRGPFKVDLASGSVLLAVDPESSFFLDAETVSGSVRSDMPLRRAPSPDPSSGKTGHTVRVRTRSGSIRVVPR